MASRCIVMISRIIFQESLHCELHTLHPPRIVHLYVRYFLYCSYSHWGCGWMDRQNGLGVSINNIVQVPPHTGLSYVQRNNTKYKFNAVKFFRYFSRLSSQITKLNRGRYSHPWRGWRRVLKFWGQSTAAKRQK